MSEEHMRGKQRGRAQKQKHHRERREETAEQQEEVIHGAVPESARRTRNTRRGSQSCSAGRG